MSGRSKFIWEYERTTVAALLRWGGRALVVGAVLGMLVVRYTSGRHDTGPEFVVNFWIVYVWFLLAVAVAALCEWGARKLTP